MRRIDELHLDYPFAYPFALDLHDLLRGERHRDRPGVGGDDDATDGIEALYRQPNTSKPADGHKIYQLVPAKAGIENETFNVLRTNGYNLEHNFGHGKSAAVLARGPTYRFFEHLRTVTAYVVFQDWPHLLRSIAAAAIRPP